MPVNFPDIAAGALRPVAGIRLATAEANIRKPGRKDVLVIAIDPGAVVAGVFTQNRFCAAPVQVCHEHLAVGSDIRALVINTGNANAGTGDAGLAHARRVCADLAALLAVPADRVLPFSTGVILEPLPVERLCAALPACAAHLGDAGWLDAATAIMTTDIVPKAASRQVRLGDVDVVVTGIAKGSGMIHPNMATMLSFVTTDAAVAPQLLDEILRHAADHSFNCITVDGDTSTNDSCILVATGAAGATPVNTRDGAGYRALREAVTEVMVELAQMIVRDGEGATKFMTIAVEGGRDRAECRQVAYAIAHSPLVKTAFYASDPNLGRILAAIGYAGIDDLDVAQVRVWLEDVLVAEAGGRSPGYREEDGVRVMAGAEITIRVDLGRGAAAATVWTCDFSHDYVTINADYRS